MEDNKDAYLEGDRAEHRFNMGLFRRLLPFLKPYTRLIVLSVLMILITIGLELSMPYITKIAVDGYLVPYYLRLDSARLDQTTLRQLRERVGERQIIVAAEAWYLPESVWRRQDPALISGARRAGALASGRWYCSDADDGINRLAEQSGAMFIRAGGKLLIAEEQLAALSGDELRLLRRHDAVMLVGMAVLLCLATLAIWLVTYYQALFLEKAGQLMLMDMRLYMYRHILGRSMFFFARHPLGKLVTRVNNDVQSISELFRNMLVGLFKDFFMFAGVAAAMFMLNARLAAICMLAVPVMSLITYYMARFSKVMYHRLQGYTGRMNTLLQETLAGITAIKLLGAEQDMLTRLSSLNQSHFRAGRDQTFMFAVFTPLIELLASLAIALIFWYGGGSVIQDRISLGTLVAFLTYMQMLLVPVRDLNEKYNHLQGALTSTERIFALLDDRDETVVQQDMPKLPAASEQREAGLAMVSVVFGYQPAINILNGFDLTIPQGQSVTIVGPSGGGKSTLVNLMLNLYQPLSGSIRLDGRELKDIEPPELARHVALVSQETVLLADTVERNISLGREHVTPGMLADAVRVSGIDAWLGELEQGIHTRIGEGGRQLSQGQYQMLALARALAGAPQVLVLDEAFCHIDPDSERRIMQRLFAAMAGRTCISVAHRLSMALYSDRILVVMDGQVVEDGDHSALLAANGVYAGLLLLRDNNGFESQSI